MDESAESKAVIILGGGPNRIGQGIEFDYCCCHASFALRELGYESVMVNSNPETVSTDYDTSTRLYFEPLTREDVLHIVERERPLGVIVQLGGQTPLNLAVPLERAGVHVFGTPPDSIDRAEDRERFRRLLARLGLTQPASGTASSFEEARGIAAEVAYPVLVRPSYVLGGRAMVICYDEGELETYMAKAVDASPDHPVLIDKFLEDAIEVDVDCIADGQTVVVGGYMEHIEEAGIHSGDSACAVPPISLTGAVVDELRRQTHALALELGVRGLMNVQYAIRNEVVYVLEVNPRASRTVPFVSKTIGVSLAALATKVMMGKTLDELGFTEEVEVGHVAVKEAVFPFSRFPGVDATLGPEMKSTGEVMGIDTSFPMAFAKSELAAGQNLPTEGTVFISVRDRDKRHIVPVAARFAEMGFAILATAGTAHALEKMDVPVDRLKKVSEGRPNIIDCMKQGEVNLIINTPSGKIGRRDEVKMRSTAVACRVPLVTTVSAAEATVGAVVALRKREFRVKSLQEYHADVGRRTGTGEGS
jgi:carbamoyl-phosphate synthase large subunit